MITIHFMCGHTTTATTSLPPKPLNTDNGWCKHCGQDVDVSAVDHKAIAKCAEPKCQFTRYFPVGNMLAASSAAAKHMATRRHTVWHWRSDRPDPVCHAPADDPMELMIKRVEDGLSARVVRDVPF